MTRQAWQMKSQVYKAYLTKKNGCLRLGEGEFITYHDASHLLRLGLSGICFSPASCQIIDPVHLCHRSLHFHTRNTSSINLETKLYNKDARVRLLYQVALRVP